MRDVIPGRRIPSIHCQDFFDTSMRRAFGNVDDDIDGACDGRLLRIERYAADHAFETIERLMRGVAMDSRTSSTMARAPCIDERERLAAADFADNNAIW